MIIRHSRSAGPFFLAGVVFLASPAPLSAQDTRLLRQPTLSAENLAFVHGGDLWVVDRAGGRARRLTSTPAVERDPHFSPDGRMLAFSSNRSGTFSVYVLPIEGGTPTRLSWYPADSYALGWTPDGSRILYASSRETAPAAYQRLWTVSREGGPSESLPAPRGHTGCYSADGTQIVIDRVARWDSEWRHYRGGQNKALVILDLEHLGELHLPNERTTDIRPVWMDGLIYFLSDRDWSMNIFSFDPASGALDQLTDFPDIDVKWLSGHGGTLAFERDGWIHTLDTSNGEIQKLEITVQGDFPWAETRWEDVSDQVQSSSLSATGKRALFEARGEIFTVPVEKGDSRNITRSSGAADRAPVWSPDGSEIAWFSDSGNGYELLIAAQDGLSAARRLSIGESKMAWEPTWSPDGTRIAFVDDDVRVRVVVLETGEITTADSAGANIERGDMGLSWSPDSKWLAYAKTFPNNLHRIVAWSAASGEATPMTNPLADAVAPSWDRGGRYLYFLASTDLALASGWANTSTMQAKTTYAAYVTVLRAEDPTPFVPESDEESAEEAEEDDPGSDTGDKDEKGEDEEKQKIEVEIDFDGIERRTLAIEMPAAGYVTTIAGPEGSVFIGEGNSNRRDMTLHKFVIEDREAKEFIKDASRVAVSADGKKLLYRSGSTWHVVGTDSPPEAGKGAFDVELQMHLDRQAEWQQIFDEAWRYERDFFYDPDMHGRDWDVVRERYAPLVPFVRHRTDLSYILDQVNGELSVGHSFVFGGDFPETDDSKVGLLGADLMTDEGRWKIVRIYTFESWNPQVSAPLDRPGLKIEEGHYIVAIDGVELTAADDPYRLLDGTAGRQTILSVNDKPSLDGAWRETVEPTDSERDLRQLAWVEDNRRRVDELSDGKLAYVWVPNTSIRGVISFNRYFFAQQDKLGAVIDERFNGGGLLDDYMVDLMTRKLRAAITNEVPNGSPFRLPAGILGPKVLLINELAGSGGDYFPWVFRQQQAGPLIGTRTWGGLVKSSVHYSLVDGGGLTAPDNAVFDPINNRWIAENEGVPPDIEIDLDARSVAEGRDVQLERGVDEALRLLEEQGFPTVEPPPFSRPAEPRAMDERSPAKPGASDWTFERRLNGSS
jgi:tricorn protease